MDLQETLKEINQGREKAAAAFVFSLWKNPELYDTYKVDKDTLQRKDAWFYWQLGNAMHRNGIEHFDSISIETFLSGQEKAQKLYEKYGGHQTVKELMSLVTDANAESYYDMIIRMNSLQTLAKKTDELFSDVHRFDWSTPDDIYNTWETINNTVALNTSYGEKIENLTIDDKFLDKLKEGEDVGYNYGKFCPALNYITLGIAPSSLYMVGAHSGIGKSSFIFENMLMGLHYREEVGDIGIISNEMKIEKYQHLLLCHVLTKDMKYFGLTRKQLQIGKFTEEQENKIKEATKIIQEKYQGIHFVKLFDNNINKIIKYIKQMAYEGVKVMIFDTFKASENVNDRSMWETLLMDSRQLFQLCSRLDIALITSYQLALHTQNIRYLDATCLSNGKQIKEVYETIVMLRPLWHDEYTGEKHDVHAWKWKQDDNFQYIKDENGKRIKEEITLDKEEKYILVFVDKTRADEDKQVVIYRWRGRFNEFRELGYAQVNNAHIYNG